MFVNPDLYTKHVSQALTKATIEAYIKDLNKMFNTKEEVPEEEFPLVPEDAGAMIELPSANDESAPLAATETEVKDIVGIPTIKEKRIKEKFNEEKQWNLAQTLHGTHQAVTNPKNELLLAFHAKYENLTRRQINEKAKQISSMGYIVPYYIFEAMVL